MAVTGLQIITRALKALGQLDASEVPTANEASDALASLNDLLGSWGLSLQGCPTIARLVLPLVASQQAYTVGDGADLDTVRPTAVISVSVVPDRAASTVTETPIGQPLTWPEWQAIPVKSEVGTLPRHTHYDTNVDASGFATLSVYPIPSTSDPDLIVYAAVPLAAFDLSTAVELPSGWERALRTNLAIEIAPEYGATVHPDLRRAAEESRTSIERMNHRAPVMQMDAGLPGMRSTRLFDVFSGR